MTITSLPVEGAAAVAGTGSRAEHGLAPDVEPRLSYVFGRLERVLRRRLGAAVESHGLTLPAYTALSVLQAQDGLSNAQLARRSLITPQSMSEVLAFLVERGFVRRSSEPDDRRIVRIELTAQGIRVLSRCNREVTEIEQEMLADLDDAEASALRDLLGRCSVALQRAPSGLPVADQIDPGPGSGVVAPA